MGLRVVFIIAKGLLDGVGPGVPAPFTSTCAKDRQTVHASREII
jgi:hypothetical protein